MKCFTKIRSLFKKQPSELEQVMLEFFTQGGYKKFAKAQSEAMVKEQHRLANIEKKEQINNRYKYLSYRIKKGMKMSDKEWAEFEWAEYWCTTFNKL